MINAGLPRGGVVALLGLALCGCAAPAPKPVTQLTPAACQTALDLTAARPFPVGDDAPLLLDMNDTSPCLLSAGGSAERVQLLRLPAPQPGYQVEIESLLHGKALFAVEAVVLDATGTPVRTLRHDRFVMRGDRLHGVLFVKSGPIAEPYLLLRSASGVVGQAAASTTSTYGTFTLINVASAALLGAPLYHAVETEQTVTRVHNGRLRVSMKQADTAR